MTSLSVGQDVTDPRGKWARVLEHDGLITFALVLLAFLIRAVFFYGLFFDDDQNYVFRAYQLLHHHALPLYGNNGLRVGTYAPAALAYWLFGINSVSIALFPLALSLLSVAAVYRLGLLLFDRTAAVFAAVLLAFFPLDAELATRLLPDPLLSAVSLLTFYALLRADFENIGQTQIRRKFSYFGAGLLLGYLPMINMSSFPLLLFFGVYLLGRAVAVVAKARRTGCPWARQMIWPALLVIAGFAVFAAGEGFIYWRDTGDFLHKYRATLSHYNIENVFRPNLRTYPDNMFLLTSHTFSFSRWKQVPYGFFYFALTAFLAPGLWKWRRRYLPIGAWFLITFGYLQFGSMSFTEYHPLHRMPRHLEMVTPPMILLLAAGLAALAKRRFGKWLSYTTVLFLVVTSWVILADDHQKADDALMPQKAIREFVVREKPARVYAYYSTFSYQRFLNQFATTTKFELLQSALSSAPEPGYVVLDDLPITRQILAFHGFKTIPSNWKLAYRLNVERRPGLPANRQVLIYEVPPRQLVLP